MLTTDQAEILCKKVSEVADVVAPDHPVLAQTLRDTMPKFFEPESPNALTPRQLLAEAAVLSDTLNEDIRSLALHA